MRRFDFREVRRDGPAVFWTVEFYCDECNTFPVASAYVVEVPNLVQLNFFIVADQWRGRGFGDQLLSALRDRWPTITATSPMNDVASRLLKRHGMMNSTE